MIDAVKTWCPAGDRKLNGAIKRMEKRLEVLQFRAAKALSARRHKGWAMLKKLIPGQTCGSCAIEFSFGDFAKAANLTGHGQIREFRCPSCDEFLIGYAGTHGESGYRTEQVKAAIL